MKNPLTFSIPVFLCRFFPLSLPRPQVRGLHTQRAPAKVRRPSLCLGCSFPTLQGRFWRLPDGWLLKEASSFDATYPYLSSTLISSCMILFITVIIQLFSYFSWSPNLSLNTRGTETSVLYTDVVIVSSTQISRKNIKGIMRSESAEVAMKTVGALWASQSTPWITISASSPSPPNTCSTASQRSWGQS